MKKTTFSILLAYGAVSLMMVTHCHRADSAEKREETYKRIAAGYEKEAKKWEAIAARWEATSNSFQQTAERNEKIARSLMLK